MPIEVVSKPQIRFPASMRDYISDLNRLMYASRRPANLNSRGNAAIGAF